MLESLHMLEFLHMLESLHMHTPAVSKGAGKPAGSRLQVGGGTKLAVPRDPRLLHGITGRG